MRDDLRERVIAELGDEDGVLVVEETGFLEKGISRHVRLPYLYTIRSSRRLQQQQ